MNSWKNRLLNILLYPARMFERLTDNIPVLCAGIILVGAIDLILNDVPGFLGLFTGKPAADTVFNVFVAIFMLVLFGTIDVTFVSIPLYDFFRYLKKKEETVLLSEEEPLPSVPHIASPVKVMKVYIMSHFIIIPVTAVIHYVFLQDIQQITQVWLQNLIFIYNMLVFIWFASIISRGINTLFRFHPVFRRITFLLVFGWYFLFDLVFEMEIRHWLLMIFR